MEESDFKLPLTERELLAIGHVTAQWALLEALIDLLVFGRADDPASSREQVPAPMSFAQRLRLCDMLAAQRLSGADLDRLRTLIRRASDLFFEHLAVIHQEHWGLADWLAAHIRTTANDEGDGGSKDARKHVDVEALERTAEEIAAINRDLVAHYRGLASKLLRA